MWPSITSALRPGNALHAATQALTKNDMKPSLVPCVFSKLSLYLLRRSSTAVMSTSLNVVSDAASCCAWTSRAATRLRSGDITTTSSRGSTCASRSSTLDDAAGAVAEGAAVLCGIDPTSRACTRCDGVSRNSAALSNDSPLPPGSGAEAVGAAEDGTADAAD